MRVLVAAMLTLAVSTPAWAQVAKPLPMLVFDAHGFMTSVGDTTTANDLHVTATNLPSKVRGFTLAGNFYLLRGPGLALGFSGEFVNGRGRHTTTDPNGVTPDIKTATRITGFSGNVSLNFGKRNGWSYLTGGYGPMHFWSYLDDGSPRPAPPSSNTLNFGGGARWFSSSHVAFSFDVRFYYTSPQLGTEIFPGRGRKKLTFLSAGISIR